jgi:predicted Zn-dependent peptidase
MNLLRLIIFMVLLLAGGSAAFADVFPGGGELDFLRSSVKKKTLANGLRVLLVQRQGAPVFVGQTWVKVGGVDEKPGITGIAHFFEHMAFKGTDKIGTKDYPREEKLLEELEQIVNGAADQQEALQSPRALALSEELASVWNNDEFSRIYVKEGGTSLNAATAKDYTYYSVGLPKSSFELWCWLESERFRRPVFRQFYQEREVVLEERRNGYDDNPTGRLYELLLQTAFTIHPYRLPNIGYPQDLRRATATKMKSFAGQYYRPDNSVVVVVGDLEPEAAFKTIERYFGRLEHSSLPIPKVKEVEPPQTAEREAVLNWDSEPLFFLAYHKPAYPAPDDAYFAILHDLLAGRKSSFLYKDLVIDRQLATSVGSGEAPGSRFPQLFIIEATPRTGVSNDRLRDEIQRGLERFGQMPIPPELLESAKRRVRRALLDELSTDGGLASTFGEAELIHDDWQQLFQAYDLIISTKEDQVRDLVGKYLTVPKRTYVRLEKSSTSERKR